MAVKKVSISRATEDAALTEPLLAALDAWEVPYSTLDNMSSETARQAAIRECSIFLRICTQNTQQSDHMRQELFLFNALQADKRQRGHAERHTLINLILDAHYIREPFDSVTLFIDTEHKERAFWLNELASPLGVATQNRRLSRRSAIALAVAGAVTIIAGTTAGTFFVRNKNAADAANAAKLQPYGPGDLLRGQPAWTVPISKTPVDPSKGAQISLTVANNTAYAFAPDTIIALAPGPANAPPTVLWQYASTAIIDITTPSFVNKDIIVILDSTTTDTYLSVLDIHNRSLLWQVTVSYLGISPVTVVGNTLYVFAPIKGDSSVRAYDLHSGKQLWETSMGHGSTFPQVIYDAGRLYYGDPYRFTCIRATDGKQLWQKSLPAVVVASAVVADNTVFFGTLGGFFYALDAQTGTQRWNVSLNTQIVAQALVVDSIVYVGDVTGYLWAIDARTGAFAWPNPVFAGFDEKTDPGTPYALIQYQPVANRNLIGVVAGDTLSAIDLQAGKRSWSYQTQSGNVITLRGIATGPFIFGKYFVIGDMQNHVIAINP